ncbi:MAG: membrane dipeptidase [Pseudomonadota bacterium]
MTLAAPVIDALQYCNWSEEIFRDMRAGGVDAIHVTIAYHETFREMVGRIEAWNTLFLHHRDLILPGRSARDIDRAQATGRTAVFFGFQNPSPIEDDLGLIEVCYDLGARFMQLTYNNQSLIATGCYEDDDTGLTRFGKEVVAEMNRLGLVVDMSHSGERSTLEAIDASSRPIAITHANPWDWHPVPRNKSETVLRALTTSGGMLGFSLYPHHLAGGSDCTLEAFCQMVADTAESHGAENLGIGSDLCQNQPDSVVHWMRDGRWKRPVPRSEDQPGFPTQPAFFRTNRDFPRISRGLRAVGFDEDEVVGLMGGNWYRFFTESFEPMEVGHA